VLALTRDDAAGGRALSVVRVDAAGAVVDEQTIAQTVASESWLQGVAVATRADGGALVVYGFQQDLDRTIRVARIAPDGTVDDATSSLPDVPRLVRGGDTLLALSPQGADGDTALFARVLDEAGRVLEGPAYAGRAPYGWAEVVPVSDGFVIVSETVAGSVEVGRLDADGARAAEPVVVAERYELGGCSASGGGAGLGVALFAVLLTVAPRRRA
jgi:hypothetical protein